MLTASTSGFQKNQVAVLLVLALISFLPQFRVAEASEKGKVETQIAIVESFISGGARQLAMRAIEKNQQSDTAVEDWMRWERLRIKLYRDQGEWSAISARIGKMPASMPIDFRQWLLTEAAQAELKAYRGAAARKHLRRLVWGGEASDKKMAHWRRLIIRSYLVDNRIEDARTALLRYKADYRATSDSWQILHARVLMRGQDYQQAFQVLSDIQTVEADLLRLKAALYSGIYKPDTVMAKARRLAGRPRISPAQMRKIWLLANQAALKLDDQNMATAFLELAMNIELADNPNDPFFPVAVDDLWKSYSDLAETVGNRERLLVGDDPSWMKTAESLRKSDGVASRSIYGLLASRVGVSNVRDNAHLKLTESLFADDKQTAARALYARSKRFESPTAIPDAVRYQLANEALKAHDIHQAAIWMKDLHLPPADENVDQWTLRRARTLVYAGDSRPAIEVLRNMVSERETLTDDMAKRTIQVLFDLQAVREHGDAYRLFQLVYDRVGNQNIKRELLYWMAESKVALKQYQAAATLYLRSATLGQPKGADLWGQSARYQAAEALGKAGFIEDARSIYSGLLRVADDAKRRALIERRMQQLWLLENRNTTQ